MSYLKSLHVEQHGAISCVHLATPSRDTLEYLACEAAIASGAVEVREVSDAGDVNALEVLNNADQHLFMMDGDMLEGAKQTRVLNTSVFLAPRSRSIIPVSCVEQGRWRYTSRSFRGSRSVAPRSVRAAKSESVAFSLRSSGRHEANQSRVWDEVSSIDENHNVHSPSLSLADTYAHLEKDIDALTAAFQGDLESNGFAILIGKQLLGIDIFNRRDVCASYLPKILRAVAIEAVHLGPEVDMPKKTEASFRAVDFMDRISDTETETHPGVALGEETRFSGDMATGFTLRYDDYLVHHSAMVLEKTGG
ncbi:MAG: DUF6569 family protein [Bacteroidota bacterium]|nr:DUF6569 family protein [Bacteroidota bacterium]